ncbi:MASE1 domain-containing protein [Sphingomonas sp. DT-51]|uniref:MASE1 domain-containing protein n=1 Tax=Sphingomonas sp. DT-51 TaxID=3396165 RepID=UPI003F196F99
MFRRVLPRLTAVPLLVGILYWVAATTSLWLTSGTDGVSSMWPASGVLLAAVIRTSGRTKVACIVAAAAASAAANLMAGMSPTVSAGFTIANVFEALAGGWIWSRLSDGRRELSSWVDVLRLATSVIGSACVSAVLAAATLGRPGALFVLSWFCTVALGMLLVTPVVMTDERFLEADSAKPDVARRTWWLGALPVVTVASFAQAGYPLLFLPLAVLLGVTWHVGLKGSASGLLLISLVGSVCTDLGRHI